MPVKHRHFPELHVDPYHATAEDLKPRFVHLEDDLYYQFIPLLEDHVIYLGKKDDHYYPVHLSYNVSENREADIIRARTKWIEKRAAL